MFCKIRRRFKKTKNKKNLISAENHNNLHIPQTQLLFHFKLSNLRVAVSSSLLSLHSRAHKNTEGTSPRPALTVSAVSFNRTHTYITEIMSRLSIFLSFLFIPQSSEAKDCAVNLLSPDSFCLPVFNSNVSPMTPCL